jgi:hypothetical protein
VTALALEPRVTRGGAESLGARTGSADLGGEPTLDALVSGAWEGLAAHTSVACPVCEEQMAPVYGAHALPIAGLCRSCGTQLS